MPKTDLASLEKNGRGLPSVKPFRRERGAVRGAVEASLDLLDRGQRALPNARPTADGW
jgi:hypothetical protein